jgi:hypothetical protein
MATGQSAIAVAEKQSVDDRRNVLNVVLTIVSNPFAWYRYWKLE